MQDELRSELGFGSAVGNGVEKEAWYLVKDRDS